MAGGRLRLLVLLLLAGSFVSANSAVRFGQGTFVGDGTDSRPIEGIGFRPDVVLVVGENDEVAALRSATMPASLSKPIGPNDPLEVDGIVSLDADGFTIGPSPRVNDSAVTYHWFALQGSPGLLELGNYTGNGDDLRPIDVGFEPIYVVVMAEDNDPAMQRFANQANDESLPFDNTDAKTDRIERFTSTGFVVGRHNSVNESDRGYHWFALADDPLSVALGTYLGDETSPRTIEPLPFRPEGLMIKANSGSEGTALRTSSMTGATSMPVDGGEMLPETILDLLDTGFVVGSDNRTNENGKALHWIALRDTPQADLSLTASVDRAAPAEGDTVTFEIVLRNEGPAPATSIVAETSFDAGLVPVSFLADRGAFDVDTRRWRIDALDVSATARLQVAVLVDVGTAGRTLRGAGQRLASDQVDPVGANDTAMATLVVAEAADLAVTSSIAPLAVEVGDEFEYTVGVENQGPARAAEVQVWLDLPSKVDYVTDDPDVGVFDSATGIWRVGAMSPGATTSLRLTGRAGAGSAGNTLDFIASITSASPDPETTNDTTTSSLRVRAADVAVDVSTSDTGPNIGDTVVWSVAVTNEGPDDALSVVVEFERSLLLAYAGSTASQGSYSDLTGLWNVGAIAVGDTAWLDLSTLVLLESAGVDLSVQAEVSSASVDPDVTNNVSDASTRVLSADLSTEMSATPAVANPGDLVTLSVVASNDGPDAVDDVEVDVVLPPDLALSEARPVRGSYDGPSGRWALGALAVGESVSLELDVLIAAGTAGLTPTATSTIASTVDDPIVENDTSVVTVDVQAIDLGLDVSVSDLAPDENEVITYTIEVTNDGPDDATGVVVARTPPAGTTFQSSVPGSGSYDEGVGQWSVGDLATGASATLALIVSVDPGTAGSTLTETVTIVASDQVDVDPSNDTASVSVTVFSADLALSSIADSTTPDEGDTVTIRVKVENLGPKDVTGVVVAAPIVSGLEFLSASASRGGYDEPSGQWTVGALVAGARDSLDLKVRIAAGSAGSTIVHASSVIASSLSDPVADNDSTQTILTVFSADVGVRIRSDVASANEGDPVRFVVTLENFGPNVATGVAATESLSTGLTVGDATPSRGSYDPATGVWLVGDLNPGAVDSLVVDTTVDAATAGTTLDAKVRVSASDLVDPVASNGADAASIRVRSVDLETSSDLTPALVNAGDSVEWTITIRNRGPDLLESAGTDLALPPGLTLVSGTATHGSWDPGARRWSLGALGVDATADLVLELAVDDTFTVTESTLSATRNSTRPADVDDADDDASVTLSLAAADLVLDNRVDTNEAEIGDTVTFTITVANRGPDAATTIAVVDTLPTGASLVESTAEAGTYDPATGRWEIETLDVGASRRLDLVASIDPGTSGTTLSNRAHVVAVDQIDPVAGDTDVVAEVAVRTSDLELVGEARDATLEPGASTPVTLRVKNRGPGRSTSIEVGVDADPEIELAVTEVAGTYDAEQKLWAISELAAGSTAELVLTATAAIDAPAGPRSVTAAVIASGQSDTNASNDSTVVTMDVVQTPGRLDAQVSRSSGALPPGAPETTLLTVEIENSKGVPDTVRSVALRDASEVQGSPAQRDASWKRFVLYGGPAANVSGVVASATMADGELAFPDLALAIPAKGTLRFELRGGASLLARDGDRLDLALDDASAFGFSSGDTLATMSAEASGGFDVDGMTAGQIVMTRVDVDGLRTGQDRQKVLEFVVPANGYASDVLRKLNLVQYGNARASTLDGAFEIEGLEAWADDGDDRFDPGVDTRLGPFSFTGDRWELTGLSRNVPLGGLRVFVTANIEFGAELGRTVELGIPGPPDPGIGVASGNDGPIDRAPDAAAPLSIIAVDRITVAAGGAPGAAVAPGARVDPVLELVLNNSYADDRTLTRLVLENATLGSGTPAELDASFDVLTLRLDANGDGGIDDNEIDPVLGTGAFVDGRIVFDQLGTNVPSDASVTLFVQCRVSSAAADGDVLRLRVAGPSAMDFAQPTGVSGSWPVLGAEHPIDGMVASQITVNATGTETLGALDDAALVLDVTLPSNGYRDDVLQGLRVRNAGTATTEDLSELRLWRDGGDGVFDAGSSDDQDLGAFTAVAEDWQSPLLDESLSPTAEGRFFVSATVGATPTDSTSLRLSIPIDGATVESGHDGPIDHPVLATSSRLLSSAPLLASIAFEEERSVIDQTVGVTMVLRNAGAETIADIVPDEPTLTGDGSLTPVSGPDPPTLSLVAGAQDTVRWTYRASEPGTVTARAGATGSVPGSGLGRRALEAGSGEHGVFFPATAVGLVPIVTPAARVTQGQEAFVPLSITFDHESGAGTSDVAIRALALRVEADDGSPVDVADLLVGARITEGSNVYANVSSFAAGDSVATLPLAIPVSVTTNEPVTLSAQIDVSPTTTVREFRVVIVGTTSIDARDAISDVPVDVVFNGIPAPVRSGLVTVQAEVTELRLAIDDSTSAHVAPGSEDVSLLTLEATNPGVGGLTADVEIERIDVEIVDAEGRGLPRAAEVLSNLRLEADGLVTAAEAISSAADSVVTLVLSPRIRVSVDAPTSMRFVGSIAPTAAPSRFTLRIRAAGVRAVDETMRQAVPVVGTPDPLIAPRTTIEYPAASGYLAMVDGLDPITIIGARGTEALRFRLRHPGIEGTAPVRLDSLTIAAQDERRQPLAMGSIFDAIRVRRGTDLMSQVSDFDGASDRVALALDGLAVAAGDTVDVSITVDIDAAAPSSFLELWLPTNGLILVDGNSEIPVEGRPESGTALPLGSGVSRLRPPAREVAVDLQSRAPAVLVPGEKAVDFAEIALQNPTGEGGTTIALRELALHVNDREGRRVDPATGIRVLRVFRPGGSEGIEAVLDLERARVTFDPPVLIDAGAAVRLVVQVDVESDVDMDGIRLELASDGLEVDQPEGALLGIDVVPVSGRTFPMRTESANLTAAGLDESFATFPNPFAAGRSRATFVYHLVEPGDVALRIFTVRGDEVVTVIDGASRAAGLHQVDSWDGRNGRGETVRNGVYLARIEVRFASGRTEHLIRKVAVLR